MRKTLLACLNCLNIGDLIYFLLGAVIAFATISYRGYADFSVVFERIGKTYSLKISGEKPQPGTPMQPD